MAHFEITMTQSDDEFMASHESFFRNPSREPDTPYISTTTEASRYECAASRVGGTTPGPFPEGLTYAAHRKGIDWFDVTWAHQPELPLNCYLGWRGMTWISWPWGGSPLVSSSPLGPTCSPRQQRPSTSSPITEHFLWL